MRISASIREVATLVFLTPTSSSTLHTIWDFIQANRDVMLAVVPPPMAPNHECGKFETKQIDIDISVLYVCKCPVIDDKNINYVITLSTLLWEPKQECLISNQSLIENLSEF